MLLQVTLKLLKNEALGRNYIFRKFAAYGTTLDQ
jgi:hypothetical protein